MSRSQPSLLMRIILCFHVAQTGKHLRTQNVSEQNQKHFLSRTQNLCPQQVLYARANGETFVSATMCPRLPGPLLRNTLVP